MDLFLFLAVLCGGSVRWANGHLTCEHAHYQRCLQQLVSFADKKDLLFANSAQELKQECVPALNSLWCLTRYSKNCLSAEDRPKYAEVMSGPQKITEGLCGDHSDFAAEYIEGLPCLRNMSGGLRYCTEKYERNQNDIELMAYEYKAQLQCCSFDGYRRCLAMVIATQGECRERGQLLDDMAGRLGGELSGDACHDYVERCTGTSHAVHVAPTSLIAVLVAVFCALL